MKKIRTATIVLVLSLLLPAMISCSKLAALTRKKSDTAKYTNSDYHFSLVYPSYFSEVKEIPSEENGDEYRIEFRHGEDDVITVDITYKTASDLYEFAELSGFDKNKIVPLLMEEFPDSVNSFVYDNRDCSYFEKPSYTVYASTKRMLYTVKYEFERGDENADMVCDALSFEFDMYANVPKDNQFLSFAYKIYNKTSSVCVPADYDVKLYPDPESVPAVTVDEESGKVIRPDYSPYRTIEAYSDVGYLYLSLPEKAEYSLKQLNSEETDPLMKLTMSELFSANLSDVVFAGDGSYNVENSITYRKLYFTCMYGDKPAYGTLTVGFTAGLRNFKSVYLITEEATAAEKQCYNDMLRSMDLH